MAVKSDRTKTRPDNTDSKRLAPQGNAESDLPLHSETTDDGETGVIVTGKQQLHVVSETVTVQAGLRVRCEYIMTGT